MTNPNGGTDYVRDVDILAAWFRKHPEKLALLEEAPVEAVSEAAKSFATDVADDLLRDIRRNGRRMLRRSRRRRRGFERRLARRWRTALDLSELILTISLEFGQDFNARHRPEAAATNDAVFEVLTRLHARTCLTMGEILALLRGGLASGAHARWRTIHELAVIAFFVKERGQDVANRFLLHEVIESHRAALAHQQHHAQLGMEPLEAAQLDEIRRRYDALRVQFGARYDQDYGWAAEDLFPSQPQRRVNFRDLEEAVHLDHLRPYYRMASYPVHAGAKGIRFNLGNLDDSDLMLAGPSNAGLADPGHAACISLGHVAAALLTSRSELRWIPVLHVLNALTRDAGDAFLYTHEHMLVEMNA